MSMLRWHSVIHWCVSTCAARVFPTATSPCHRRRISFLISTRWSTPCWLFELHQDRIDLKPVLGKVLVPTLVIHRRGDQVPFSGGRELASRIPGARFLPLEGYNHLPATFEEAMELATPVLEFLQEGQAGSAAPPVGRDLPVILLYADMTAARSLKLRLSGQALVRVLHTYKETIRRAIASYNGNEVNHTGKGIAACFFSASRAVGCALQIQHALALRNAANPEDAVSFRIGLNAGEPHAEDKELFAPLVVQARQICERAKTGQLLVSEVVRQLVPGKGFVFERLGEKTLKGFDEPVALYTLVHDSATSVKAHRSPTTTQ